MKIFTSIAIFLLLTMSSCTNEENIASQENNTVTNEVGKSGVSQGNNIVANIDIQNGLQDHFVSVSINQQLSFHGSLSSYVPLAGPLVKFSASLVTGSNTVTIQWRENSSGRQGTKEGSVTIFIGESEKYYIGLAIVNGALEVKVQETPFLYL